MILKGGCYKAPPLILLLWPKSLSNVPAVESYTPRLSTRVKSLTLYVHTADTKNKIMKAKFKGTLVSIIVSKVVTPHKIRLDDVEDGMPYATATLALPEMRDIEGYVAIKDYSENEGMLDFLIENKIVSEPVTHIQSGFVKVPICKLL